MKKILISIVFLSSSFCLLNAHENNTVHPTAITEKAVNLIHNNLGMPYKEIWETQNNGGYFDRSGDNDDIREGTIEEDGQWNWAQWWQLWQAGTQIRPLWHFYNPATGHGIIVNKRGKVYQELA